jgi:hypothetical protein
MDASPPARRTWRRRVPAAHLVALCGIAASPLATAGATAAAERSSPADSFATLVFVRATPDVPAAVVAEARGGVNQWFETEKRLRRMTAESAGLDEEAARACAAARECARGLYDKGIALLVFVDVAPSSGGLNVLRVWAVSGVDGKTQVVGYQEFGSDGASAYLSTIPPHLIHRPTSDVLLKVEPRGATHRLNGWALPPGTDRLDGLVPGRYRLRTELTGYATDVREFTVGLMDDPSEVVEVVLLPLSDIGPGKNVALYVGVGAAVAAVLAGGIVLAVVLARGGGRCGDAAGCGPW